MPEIFQRHKNIGLVSSWASLTSRGEGASFQEASSSAGKNTGVVLVPCSHMEVCSYSYFCWC